MKQIRLTNDGVTLDGRRLRLQHKSLKVLETLVTRAPDIVTRAELIEAVWANNYLVGGRGLNQALWSIRIAIGDDARQPKYIRTIPREGYQWLGQPARKKQFRGPAFSIAASVCISIIGLALATSGGEGAKVGPDGRYSLPSQCEIDEKSDVTAYQRRNDVVVDIENGCRLIATPEGDKTFGSPVVSADGQHVAFTVTENQTCRFIMVALQDGERTEFDRC